MCGILFAKSLDKTPVNKLIINQYQNQKSRGVEGFGVVYLEDGKVMVERATEPLKFLLDLHPKVGTPSDMILAHHRYPTSSPNKTGQTHPILVSNDILKYNYLIVHNGIIHNSEERKKVHESLNIPYTTQIVVNAITKFNDSESLAIDLALLFEKKIEKIESRGSAAFAGIQIDKKTQKPVTMFFGRNDGNPLHYSRNQKTILLSSEGVGEETIPDTMTMIDLTDPKLKQKTIKLKIPYYSYINTPVTEDQTIIELNPNKTETDNSKDDNYAYYHSKEYRFNNPKELDTEEEIDPEFSEFIDSIEVDLEDKLAIFIESLTNAKDLADSESLIQDMVISMRDYTIEMENYFLTRASTEKEIITV